MASGLAWRQYGLEHMCGVVPLNLKYVGVAVFDGLLWMNGTYPVMSAVLLKQKRLRKNAATVFLFFFYPPVEGV